MVALGYTQVRPSPDFLRAMLLVKAFYAGSCAARKGIKKNLTKRDALIPRRDFRYHAVSIKMGSLLSGKNPIN